jgi:hypothetical protein
VSGIFHRESLREIFQEMDQMNVKLAKVLAPSIAVIAATLLFYPGTSVRSAGNTAKVIPVRSALGLGRNNHCPAPTGERTNKMSTIGPVYPGATRLCKIITDTDYEGFVSKLGAWQAGTFDTRPHLRVTDFDLTFAICNGETHVTMMILYDVDTNTDDDPDGPFMEDFETFMSPDEDEFKTFLEGEFTPRDPSVDVWMVRIASAFDPISGRHYQVGACLFHNPYP